MLNDKHRSFVCLLFVPSLSSCHEKATVALFSGCFFDFLPLNLLLVRSHQAEIIIVMRLIQGRNNVYDEGGSWTYITRSWLHGRHKNSALTLSATLPTFCSLNAVLCSAIQCRL